MQRVKMIACALGIAGLGVAQTTMIDLRGSTVGEDLGASAAGIGDVDGDGVPDAVYSASDGVTARSGFAGVTLWTAPLVGSGEALRKVRAAGDVDGDGVGDVAVGGRPIGGNYDTFIRVYSGASGAVVLTVPQPAGIIAFFFYDAGGDFDGDGTPDLLAASYSGATSMVHVFSGVGGTQIASVTFSGPGSSGASSGAFAPDLDGDGDAEIVVGQSTQATAAGHGRASFYFGPNAAYVFQLVASNYNSMFGTNVAFVGDVNGDGAPDVAIADANAWTLPSAPYIRVHSGADASLLYALSSAVIPGAQGFSISALGDLNGDGAAEFAVGGINGFGGLGGFSVVSGATGTPLFSEAAAAFLYSHIPCVASAGDVNLDGVPDLLVGDGSSDLPVTDAGRLRVISGVALSAAGVVDLGGGCGAGPVASFFTADPPVIGGSPTLALSGATPLAVGNLALDFGFDVPTTLGSGCVFHLDLAHAASWTLIPVATDATGGFSFPIAVPTIPLAAGLPVTMQVFLFGGGPFGFELSNGVRATLGF
jgi:hypothetical protein